MEAGDFDEIEFFRAIAISGVRALASEVLWSTRRSLKLTPDVAITIPDIAGLILTKRIAARPKDLEDIRLLEVLRREEER
jgi:hypothetical protein